MGKVVKPLVKATAEVFTGGLYKSKGLGFKKTVADAAAQQQANPAQEEYERRKKELAGTRTKDVGSMRARMAAGGVREGSEGWEQGLQTVLSAYDKKLEQLGADPYFKDINKTGWI